MNSETNDAKAIVDTAIQLAQATYEANDAFNGRLSAPATRVITTVCSSISQPIIEELLRRGIGFISERSSWADEHCFGPGAIFSGDQLNTEAEAKGCEVFAAHLVQAGCDCECWNYYGADRPQFYPVAIN